MNLERLKIKKNYVVYSIAAICLVTAVCIMIGLCNPHGGTVKTNASVDENSSYASMASDGNSSSGENQSSDSSVFQDDSDTDESSYIAVPVINSNVQQLENTNEKPNESSRNEPDDANNQVNLPVKPPSGDPNQKVAYLTFDDGPSAATPQLLDILNSFNIHATFFVIGNNAQRYSDSLKRIVNEGNSIGIHSWTHQYSYIYSSTDNFTEDFNRLDDYIKQTTGAAPNICRFPGGTNNTVCFKYNKDHIMKKIVGIVESRGFKYFDWNVSSEETTTNPPSKDQVVNNVISQSKGRDMPVILFHDIDNQNYLDALTEIIRQLDSMGYRFGTLTYDNPTPEKAAKVQFDPS